MAEGPAHLVVLGASAGGYEAIVEFFVSWVPNPAVAIVVIQHLPPEHPSLMLELLARHTAVPLRPASSGSVLAGGSAYLIQPGDLLHLRDGALEVTPIGERGERWRKHPIDTFLGEAAAAWGRRVIAVILSGTGNDGTEGAKAVAEAGGRVLVQHPGSAQFDGMPRSAADGVGGAAVVMAPGELAEHCHRLLSPDAADRESATVLQLDRIVSLLGHHTGRDFAGYKRATFLRRVERRMAVAGVGIAAYVARLEHDAAEAQALTQELLIRVTRFFRDPAVWAALAREAIPRLIRRRIDRRRLRCWVCGCSSGEEAYTLAMLLHDAVADSGEAFEITIFATDIDAEALQMASQGVYREGQAESCPTRLLDRYAKREPGAIRIGNQIRQSVVFSQHDALQDPPFTDIDLVVCRNLLIYYNASVQYEVLGRFAYSLIDGGSLLLGASEALPQQPTPFELEDGAIRLCRRLPRSATGNARVRLPPPHGQRAAVAHGAAPSPAVEAPGQPPVDAWWQRLAANAGLAGLVVDRGGTVQHTFGSIERALRLAAGPVSLRIEDMLADAYRHPVLAALHESRETGVAAEAASPDGSARIVVEPVEDLGGRSGHLVQVLPRLEHAAAAERLPGNERHLLEQRVRQLESGNRALQQALDQAQERTAAISSELQSANEELKSTNEELQSTNEELQSVNEELHTVNAELQEKLGEVEQINGDLTHLVDGTQTCAVFCDHRLHIRRITSGAIRLLGLQNEDVGRPLAQMAVAHCQEGGVELRVLAAQAMERERRTSRRFELPGVGGVMVTCVPIASGGRNRGGLILTFMPLAELEQLQNRLDLADRRLRSVLLNLPGVMLMVVDRSGRIADAAGAGLEAHGIVPAAIIGRPAGEVLAGDDAAVVGRLVDDALAGGGGTAQVRIQGHDNILRVSPGDAAVSASGGTAMLLAFNVRMLTPGGPPAPDGPP